MSISLLLVNNHTAVRKALLSLFKARLNRFEPSVRKQFQSSRDRLGARSQADLARIIGVLSCFREVEGKGRR